MQSVAITPEPLAAGLEQRTRDALAGGDAAGAASLAAQLADLSPGAAASWHLLGIALKQLGRLADARTVLEQAASIDGTDPGLAYDTGVANHLCGDLDRAEHHYRRCLAVRPDHPAALDNLGCMHAVRGESTRAIDCHQRALSADAGNASAHNNLGPLHALASRLDDAQHHCRAASERTPRLAEAHANLASVLDRSGRQTEALAAAQNALDLRPGYVAAAVVAARIHRAQGRLATAEALLSDAQGRVADDPDALAGIAAVRMDQGRVAEALDCFRSAIERSPGDRELHSGYLLTLQYSPDVTPADLFAEHRRWAERHMPPARAPDPGTDGAGRRLRLGYLSSDLRQHPVARFLEPVLREHDRARFDVRLYSNSTASDETAVRLRGLADGWCGVHGWTDESIRDRIVGDRIDILIDLNGHTAGNRLGVLAMRAAPIQMTYLGYPDTTGVEDVDYRLTDAVADPPGAENRHTERLLRLPYGFLCLADHDHGFEAGPSPWRDNGFVTLGSFNNTSKLSDTTVAAWARTLRATPGCRLLIKYPHLDDDSARTHLSGMLSRHDVDPDRVTLRGRDPSRARHLERYAEIDLALDPFPYNGTTTTVEALRRGVPVITRCGERHAARVGASLAAAAGLPELVTHSDDEYVDAIVSLATRPERIDALRARVGERLRAAPAADPARFTRAFESVLLEAVAAHRAPARAARCA